MSKITFQQLRDANVQRLSSSKYKLCEQNWQPAHWVQALVGEVGEAANLLKKVDRGDFTLESVRSEIAKELADIQCYLDILAYKLDVDLGDATVSKFNEVSRRIGSGVKLPASTPIAKLVFCHGLEDSWWRLDLPDGDYQSDVSWLLLKVYALRKWPDIEFQWSELNKTADLFRCPSEIKP